MKSLQKILIISLYLLLGYGIMYSQEYDDIPATDYSGPSITVNPDALLTQHWAMPTLTNPASTGVDTTFIRIRGGARLDYLGSHQSPKNFMLTGDAPFKLLGKRIGAGVIVNSNSYFLYRNLLVGAQGSYKFIFGKSMLSVGVQLGYFHSSFKGSELRLSDLNPGNGNTNGDENTGGDDSDTPEEPEDGYDGEDWPTQDVGGGSFDASVGIRFDHPAFYVGVSALHLTNAEIRLKKDSESATDLQYIRCKVPMSLYFDAGGNIRINNSLFTLQPSVSVLTDFKEFYGVAVMRATYNQKFTFGFDYRYNRAAGVVAGLSLKNFYLGYSWEYDYKSRPKGSTGNHELVIGYNFKLETGGKNMFSHRSIRIM